MQVRQAPGTMARRSRRARASHPLRGAGGIVAGTRELANLGTSAMKAIGRAAAACAVALAMCHGTAARGATFADPLDVPARPSALASKSLLVGVARAGSRLVAVGSADISWVPTTAARPGRRRRCR